MQTDWLLWRNRLLDIVSITELDAFVRDFGLRFGSSAEQGVVDAFHNTAAARRAYIERHLPYAPITEEQWSERLRKLGYRDEEARIGATIIPGIEDPWFGSLVKWFYTDKVENLKVGQVSMYELTEDISFSVPAAFLTLHMLTFEPHRGEALYRHQIDPILAQAFEEGHDIA